MAHADTVWDREYGYDPGPTHEIKIENGEIRAVDDQFGLGADDRAGCAMLWLLKDLGHSLLVTNGEEDGQKGACWLMSDNKDISDEINYDHQFVVNSIGEARFQVLRVGLQIQAYIKLYKLFLTLERKVDRHLELCRDITGVNL